MMGSYGLDNQLLDQPFGLITSCLLLNGSYYLGMHLYKLITTRLSSNDIYLNHIKYLLGISVIALVIYPIMLLTSNTQEVIKYFAICVMVLGTLKFKQDASYIKKKLSDIKISKLKLTINNYLYFIILGLFLVSIGPLTNADSLDYHVGVPLYYLQEGVWPVTPEWFHSRLAGMGEALTALALSVGAEQFPAMVQWTGIFVIINILIDLISNQDKQLKIIPLAIVVSPLLFFLVYTAKPQLFPLSLIFGSIILSYSNVSDDNNKSILIKYSLSTLFLMTAAQMKFNFHMSAGLCWVLSVIVSIKIVGLKNIITIGIMCLILIAGPFYSWGAINFPGSWYESLITPFFGTWPGYESFNQYLRSYKDSSLPFPVSAIIPDRLGNITTVIGGGVFILLWLKPKENAFAWLLIVIACLELIITYLFGQLNSRFAFEPFLILLLSIVISHKSTTYLLIKQISFVIYAQSVLFIAIILFSVSNTSYASLFHQWRTYTMTKTAYNYSLMAKVNSILPTGAVLIMSERSMALSPRETISVEWSQYIDHIEDALVYLELLKERNVTHALIDTLVQYDNFRDCYGDVIEVILVKTATRNPFNSSGKFYERSIVNFENKLLPSCYKIINQEIKQ
jgi:hypothetical protein